MICTETLKLPSAGLLCVCLLYVLWNPFISSESRVQTFLYTFTAFWHPDESGVNKAKQQIPIRYWNEPRKCFGLPPRRMSPPRRHNYQWHEKEMRYWYSYETNVSKHAMSSAQQDEILNIHLPFSVIIELQLRERQTETSKSIRSSLLWFFSLIQYAKQFIKVNCCT